MDFFRVELSEVLVLIASICLFTLKLIALQSKKFSCSSVNLKNYISIKLSLNPFSLETFLIQKCAIYLLKNFQRQKTNTGERKKSLHNPFNDLFNFVTNLKGQG